MVFYINAADVDPHPNTHPRC